MDRAWELFWKLDQRNTIIHVVSPAEWIERPEYWSEQWEEYKHKIPRFMRPFMFMNQFSFFMEYCYRLVNESNETLRMALPYPHHTGVLFDVNTTSEQKE
jgi:hypothetical protein